MNIVGEKLYARDGHSCGTIISTRRCDLGGCGGTRVCVRWKDGKHTWPCLKGCKVRKDNHYQIM